LAAYPNEGVKLAHQTSKVHQLSSLIAYIAAHFILQVVSFHRFVPGGFQVTLDATLFAIGAIDPCRSLQRQAKKDDGECDREERRAKGRVVPPSVLAYESKPPHDHGEDNGDWHVPSRHLTAASRLYEQPCEAVMRPSGNDTDSPVLRT
jgi:hypothetical protein